MKKVGSKDYVTENQPDFIGWYRPHKRVQWTGEKLDRKTGELVKEPSRTKQSFKDECDINNIVKSFRTVQDIINLTEQSRKGVYTDLPEPFEYQDGLNTVIQAEAAFNALPAKLRTRFENNPREFLEFMSDPANQEEMIKLGLATDKRPPPSTPAPDVSTPNVDQAPEKVVDK